MQTNAYWCCLNCAHVFEHPTYPDPEDCGNCGSCIFDGFGDIHEADDCSYDLLIELSTSEQGDCTIVVCMFDGSHIGAYNVEDLDTISVARRNVGDPNGHWTYTFEPFGALSGERPQPESKLP